MSTTDSRPTTKWKVVVVLVGAAALATAFAGTYPHDQSTAWGMLAGGVVGFAAVQVIARLRRGSDDPLARQAAGIADERDRVIITQSFALVGMASFMVCLLALPAVTWGLSAIHTVAMMTWALLAVFLGAMAWSSRRH